VSTLTGTDAIAYAETHGRTLNKHADPTEGARTGLTVSEAQRVAKEDPSLIWIDSTHYACVGSDGITLVVWGLGATPEAARAEAREQETDGEDVDAMTIHPVTARQVNEIQSGVVRWDMVCAAS
jgi:hypothetical protein